MEVEKNDNGKKIEITKKMSELEAFRYKELFIRTLVFLVGIVFLIVAYCYDDGFYGAMGFLLVGCALAKTDRDSTYPP